MRCLWNRCIGEGGTGEVQGTHAVQKVLWDADVMRLRKGERNRNSHILQLPGFSFPLSSHLFPVAPAHNDAAGALRNNDPVQLRKGERIGRGRHAAK